MAKAQLRSLRVLVCVLSVSAVLVLGPAIAAPSKAARPAEPKAARASAVKSGPGALDQRKMEVLYGLIYAFVGERECDDLAVDHDALVRKLKANGLQPRDLGPGSAYGGQIDLLKQEIIDSFQENRRLACEIARDLVGAPDETVKTRAPSRL